MRTRSFPAAAALTFTIFLAPETCPQAYARAASDAARIIHHFDFDERARGNLEDIPKFWMPMHAAGFPHFTGGEFDFEVGRSAPPSFHLASDGRNVVYHYAGPATRVRPRSVYTIEGFIRPDRLRNARACLSVHFVDQAGQPMLHTLVRSPYVGGADADDGWVRVELRLSAAPREAASIGVAAWVLQEPAWDTRVPPPRHILRRDVHAGAWFDDITIRTIPWMVMTTSQPGQVLASGTLQELRVSLADYEDTTLSGQLVITAADGGVVNTRPIPVVLDTEMEPVRISVERMAPGFYTATLRVLEGDKLVTSQTLDFIRLGPRYRPSGARARSFGVVLDPRQRSDARSELALLSQLEVHSAKIPVWTGLADPEQTPSQRRVEDRMLQQLVARGFVLTGVFLGPPPRIIQSKGQNAPDILELLTDPPNTWLEHLGSSVIPFATIFRWWQLGAEGGPGGPKPDQFAAALAPFHEAMGRFISAPLLTVSLWADDQPPAERLPVEQICVAPGSQLRSEWLALRIREFKDIGYDRVSVYIEPLERSLYRRLPRLADFAQRVITARHAGAETVYVPQPWKVRQTRRGLATEATEEYLIIRTIANVLGETDPGNRVWIAPGVECLAFNEGKLTTLAMWDTKAPPQGRDHVIQLGQANRRIDLWGESDTLHRDEKGRHVVRLSKMPIFVVGVDRWLIDFRNSLTLNPAHVESGVELVRHTLEMANRGANSISGNARLGVPSTWEVSPRNLWFNLTPQRMLSLPVEIRYAHNEPAGLKTIHARINLENEALYLEVPLRVDVGLTDIEVRAMAVVERGNLLLRHVVTNRSAGRLNFRSSASVPGRERQYRPLDHLAPGETQTVEYRFAQGAALTGSKVRLGLRQANDARRTHTIELTVP